jgi:hypothetical protein
VSTTRSCSAIALGLAGDAAQATRLATELVKRFPKDRIVQSNYLPTIHTAIALQGAAPAKQSKRLTRLLRTNSVTLANLSTSFTSVAKLMWQRTKAAQPQVSFRKFSTTLVSP